MTLSWKDGYTSNMTYKPTKLGQIDLVSALHDACIACNVV